MAVPQRYGLPPVEAFDPEVHQIAAEGNQAKPQIFVDPQAGKIPRRIRKITKAATAIGGSNGLVLATVPVGAAWQWVCGTGIYAASGTAGTRAWALRFRDDVGAIILRSARGAPTAGQNSRYEIAVNFSTLGAVNLGGGGGDLEMPCPASVLPEGFDLLVLDEANIDAADTASLDAVVIEYMLPRGLARGEIPMGLESGFQWDLTQARQVA